MTIVVDWDVKPQIKHKQTKQSFILQFVILECLSAFCKMASRIRPYFSSLFGINTLAHLYSLLFQFKWGWFEVFAFLEGDVL